MSDMRRILNIMEGVAEASNYPDDIRQFDHDPRSPFYSGPEALEDSDFEEAGYTVAHDLFDKLFFKDHKGGRLPEESSSLRLKAVIRGDHMAQHGHIDMTAKDHALLMAALKDSRKAAEGIISSYCNIKSSDWVYKEDTVDSMVASLDKMVHALTSHNDTDLEYNYYELTSALEDVMTRDKAEEKITGR